MSTGHGSELAKAIWPELSPIEARVETDFSPTPIKADAEESRVHTMLVIGARDMEAGAVSVRLRHGGPQGAKPKGDVTAKTLAAIRDRKV